MTKDRLLYERSFNEGWRDVIQGDGPCHCLGDLYEEAYDLGVEAAKHAIDSGRDIQWPTRPSGEWAGVVKREAMAWGTRRDFEGVGR